MCKIRSFFLKTTQIFSTRIQDIFAHPDKWSDPRRNALAASIFALGCQKSPIFAKRETTLGIACFDFFF